MYITILAKGDAVEFLVRSVVSDDSDPVPHALAMRVAAMTALNVFNFFMSLTL
jgi:hypothetical protein